MQKAWTLPEELSSTLTGVKLQRPADASASCWPPVNSQGRTKWRPPRWAPLSHVTEQSPPRQVGNARHSPPGFSVSPRDGVDNLWTPETAREATRAPQGVPLHPSQLVPGRHNSPIFGPAAREVQPQQVQVQPHGSSFFLPGHIARKPAHFLLHSGCTTNILSRQFFDTLGVAIKRRLAPHEGGHGTLADGSCIPFCGIIELAGRARDQNIQETFIVGQLNEDAILGMLFLQ